MNAAAHENAERIVGAAGLAQPSGRPYFTQCGIRGVATVPYGAHLCHFYASRQQLVELLVPFFASGLRNNERCVWVAAEPLPAAEAKAELAKAFPFVDAALRNDRLVILPAEKWYGRALEMSVDELSAFWLAEEKKALARGFRGLRATGNVTGDIGAPSAARWQALMRYESALARSLEDRRVVVLCSYGRNHCQAAQIRQAALHHHCALERSGTAWQVCEGRFRAA